MHSRQMFTAFCATSAGSPTAIPAAISSTAAAFNRALAAYGFLKTMTRVNSKRETVEFWGVTDKGLKYGKNLTSPQCPRETQPHWYVDRFLELAGLIGKGRS